MKSKTKRFLKRNELRKARHQRARNKKIKFLKKGGL